MSEPNRGARAVPSSPAPNSWDSPVVALDTSALPPLPPVPSPDVERLAFTHKSSLIDHKDGTRSDNYLAELGSNGRLEWLGDSLLHWLVSRRLYRLFPHASSGFLTELRGRYVSNRLWSHISWHYGLPEKLVTEPPTKRKGRLAVSLEQKTAANVFEAYLGAVVEAAGHTESGLQVIEDYVDKLFTPAVFPDLSPLVTEFSRAPVRIAGEEGDRRRRLQTGLAVSNDAYRNVASGRSRTVQASTHSWTDRYIPGQKWESTLFVAGRQVGVGLAGKIEHARDAALECFLSSISIPTPLAPPSS